jgi:uncharacterized protein YjaZ
MEGVRKSPHEPPPDARNLRLDGPMSTILKPFSKLRKFEKMSVLPKATGHRKKIKSQEAWTQAACSCLEEYNTFSVLRKKAFLASA